MARTSVLTGGSNVAQTTSEDLNGLATDLLTDGIVGSLSNTSGVAPMTGGLAVNQHTGTDTLSSISAGIAWVTATPTGQGSQRLRVKIDAQNYTHASNTSGSTVYDWIYAKVDPTLANNPDVNMSTVGTIAVVRSTSNTSQTGSAPTYAYLVGIVNLPNNFTAVTNGNITDKRQQVGVAVANGADGWTLTGEAWTYASATTITVPSDATQKYAVGDRIRLKQGGGYKYFYVVGVASTTLTITGGTDYTFVSAAITDNYYSKTTSPVGFPQWFFYTPTYTGFSVAPTGGMGTRFSINGRTVKINHNPSVGTSNTNAFTISLPVTVTSLSGYASRQFGKAVDNSTAFNAGFVEILSGASTASVYKDPNGTAWTTSGSKTFQGFIEYEI